MKKKLGRPSKKEYDPEALMQELIDTVAEVYQEKKEIKATALELSLPPNKVKKLLITGKVLTYPETEQIQELQKQGKTITEIQETMGLSYSALHTYLPYTKVIYKMSEISQNAERVRNYKLRKSAVEIFTASPTEEHLWECLVAFQHYPFRTVTGLPFSYTLKIGRNGKYTKELFIDRRENSKSLTWSSVRMAFEKATEIVGVVFIRPKELADVRGVSLQLQPALAFRDDHSAGGCGEKTESEGLSYDPGISTDGCTCGRICECICGHIYERTCNPAEKYCCSLPIACYVQNEEVISPQMLRKDRW